jgi:quercetin dioxygenase-like cupin family protein
MTMTDEKFHRIRIDDAPTRPLPMGRGTVFKLVDPDIGAANADIHINVIEPGMGRGEIHFHEKAENTYIVLEGQLEVCIEGGIRHVLEVGEVGYIPPGIIHTATNARRDIACKIIEIYAPAGADFHEVDGWPAGIEPPDAG